MSTDGRLRRISGGSDDSTDIVESVLKATSLCMDCLVVKTGLPRDDVAVALKILLRTRAVEGEVGVCGSCGRPGALRRRLASAAD